MVTKTNEQALEELIENRLIEHGYVESIPHNFNAKYGIDEVNFWKYLEETHEEELEKLKKVHNWQDKVLERLDRMIKTKGTLHVLKKGLQVENASFTMFFQSPLASSSKKIKENFEKNRFSVMRQVPYSLFNPRQELDVVIFINGLPFSTMELKNPWTGQTAKFHGIRQYKRDRDNKQPLMQYGRSLVHFTVDIDEVYMTTRLNGNNTLFLPFNKGNNFGAGNPANPNGHKTEYLWDEVLSKKSIANLIQHFIKFDGKAKDPISKRTLFFPRYHQLNVVREIVAHAEEHGVGSSYLVQHSAGSGKSYSITWAAYHLIDAYPCKLGIKGARDLETPLFDSVVVVTDRRLLDKQIRDDIKEFAEVKNIVAPAHSSKELKEHLENGKKVIITTIQKFPYIIDGIEDLSDKRFAVIIDEAHASQSSTLSDKMNIAMGAKDEEDNQDKILKAMKGRKMKDNASYLAFTATPKRITLEKFGVKQDDGSFEPFHMYSMKQAIEEGFILDVLRNYTTYKSYYEILKSATVSGDEMFDSARAQKKLKAHVEKSKQTITTKAEVMLDHFIENVYNQKKLKGKAKGMVVTQDIESAIRYYTALKRALEKKKNPFKVLIAFSDKKTVDGIEYSETGMNGVPEDKTRKVFDEDDDYRILVVANKYLTGFDQPKLCAMYVDKRLQDVLAVQALSRLNRIAPKYGKKTEDLFILDFFNTVDDIKKSFDDFYTSTTLSEATDVNVLHELKDLLDSEGIYEAHEVEEFVRKYFDGVEASELSPIIDTAANRFNDEFGLEDEEKADYKIKAKQFVKIYGQMAAILPFEMVEWEKLYWFLKFLIPKLIVKNKQDELLDGLLNSVDLSTYGLERTKVGFQIKLDEAETELDPQNPNPRGVHDTETEEEQLDEIIRIFNERWFEGWDSTPEEQRAKLIKIMEGVKSHPDFEVDYANNPDKQNKDIAFNTILDEVMREARKREMQLYKQFLGDNIFKRAFSDTIKESLDIGMN